MGGLHGPLDALFEIANQRPLLAEEIVNVEVELSHAVYHHGWWELERPLTPIGAQMNIAYAFAVAILDGAAMVQQFSPHRIDQDDVWELIPRIKAHHNAEFDKAGPTGRGRSRVIVHFRDGTTLEAGRMASRSILEPQSSDEIVTKFRTLTNGLIGQTRQDEIVRVITKLEEIDDIGVLIKQLAPRVGAAF
jgi:2-methylcitrate dehydratase PrpD